MTRLPEVVPGTAERGFSLVELLIALVICGIVSASISALVPPARMAFERAPALLDAQQRARTAMDVLTHAVRSAGRNVAAAGELGPLANLVPPVLLDDDDGTGTAFASLVTIVPSVDGGQGVLDRDQAGASGPLFLSAVVCPATPAICGFTVGSSAVIADGSGRFDLFLVAAVHAGSRRLTADRAFLWPYAAGSVVLEVDADTFRLDPQADGSQTLVRETLAGAVQPVIDHVTQLRFAPDRTDDPSWFGVRRVDLRFALRANVPDAGEMAFTHALFTRSRP